LHLNLKVFEKDWDKISIGQSLTAYTNSNPEKKYGGEIILIGKNISQDRAVEVHAHFTENNAKLIPGLYMNAEVPIHEIKALALPEESVVTFEGKHYVFEVLVKNSFRMTAVEIVSSGEGRIECVYENQLSGNKIYHTDVY